MAIAQRVGEAPVLPHWETLPDDVAAAIVELKAAIRARIEWSGRSVDEVVAELQQSLQVEVDEIANIVRSGGNAWPVIEFSDVDAGTVSSDVLDLVKRRGCMVVRGTFGRGET